MAQLNMFMVEINLSLFTNILSICKTLHWSTHCAHTHETLDKAYNDFNDAFDEFVEVALGIFGRKAAKTTPISINIPEDDDLVEYLAGEFLKFNNSVSQICEGYPQLEIKFFEIKALQNKYIYLLGAK